MELAPAKPTYVPLSQQTYTEYVDEEEPDEVVVVPDYGEEKCNICWSTRIIEDTKSGDVICEGCGHIKEARSISPEAEYRVFADDDGDGESKKRVGPSYNPLLPHNFLGSKRKWERDEKEFLWEGLKNIDDVLGRLLEDGGSKPVEMRAKELFQKAFNWQFLQKQGIQSQVTSIHTNGNIHDSTNTTITTTVSPTTPSPASTTNGNTSPRAASGITMPIDKKKKQKMSQARRKFSRRKQFVVACVWWSLKEHAIDNIDVPDISELIDGKEVSRYSVKHCLKDLNLTA